MNPHDASVWASTRVIVLLTRHMSSEERLAAAAELRALGEDPIDVEFFQTVAGSLEEYDRGAAA
jgi:hypothetical protein